MQYIRVYPLKHKSLGANTSCFSPQTLSFYTLTNQLLPTNIFHSTIVKPMSLCFTNKKTAPNTPLFALKNTLKA